MIKIPRRFSRYIVTRLETIIDDRIKFYFEHIYLKTHLVFGDRSRLKIAQTAVVNNALFNLVSGKIVIEEHVFFGHNVCLLTGTHDYKVFNLARQTSTPDSGRDIIVEEGAWIASNAVVLGPCTVGRHAVVAAGSLVKADVPAYTIVAGSPAKVLKEIPAT